MSQCWSLSPGVATASNANKQNLWYYCRVDGPVAQLARAPHSHCGGCRFDSDQVQIIKFHTM